jgi:hypothetical protein
MSEIHDMLRNHGYAVRLVHNLYAENDRLRAALRAVADDSDTNSEAATFANNALAQRETKNV